MNNYLSKVGILLVVTNEAEFLPVFCKSLINQSYKDIALFVLDNNCTDNSISIIKSFIPDAFILRTRENAGFAKGNNMLAEEAIKSGCELLFTLNPDIELDENCVDCLVKLINTDEKISAVGPICFFGREDKYLNKIQFYGSKMNFYNRKSISFHSGQLFIEGEIPQNLEVNIVGGGITFIKASIVKEIGLFDERYFIYGEEIDLGLRSFRAGYKMMVTSDAKVWHHHDWSSKNKRQYYFSYYYMNRAKILYLIKYKIYIQMIIVLFSELLFFPFKVKWSLRTADLKLLRYYYSGLLDGLSGKKGIANILFDENKKAKELLLTADYELFLGEQSGSVSECMIEPTRKLAAILEKNNSRLTIFWDILHYYRLLELEKSYSELKQDRILIEEQIIDLAGRGHDIQLHIHPHWLDAEYENGKWNFNYDRFKLHKLSDENNEEDINTIIGCVSISKKLMEDLIRKVKPDYIVNSFRAGGYLIEPFEKLRHALQKNEIRIDSSVCTNLSNDYDNFSFDFSSYPAKQKYNFDISPKNIVNGAHFTEIPITTVKIPALINIYFTFLRIIKYPDLERERKGSSTGEYFKPAGFQRLRKLSALTHTKVYQLSTDGSFRERFKYKFNKVPGHSTMILHPKLINSHTLKILDDYVSANKVRFISIKDFVDQRE